jgi:hypothetical protein
VIVVLPAVLAECVFVLEPFYEHPRGDISSALGRLISSAGVEIGGATIQLDALDRYRKTKVHFADCLVAATAAAEDMPEPRSIRAFENSETFAWKPNRFLLRWPSKTETLSTGTPARNCL